MILSISLVNIYFLHVVLLRVFHDLLTHALHSRSKPRGIRAARQLRSTRRVQRWADKQYNKSHNGSVYKYNPFGGCSHAKGIVVEKVGVESKQPNSAIRKCVRVQLIKNGKKIACFVPNDGCLNFIDDNVRLVEPRGNLSICLVDFFYFYFCDKRFCVRACLVGIVWYHEDKTDRDS